MSSPDSIEPEKGEGMTSLSSNYLEGSSSAKNTGDSLPKPFVNLIIFSSIITIAGIVVAGMLLAGEEETSHNAKLLVGSINSILGSLLSAAGMILQKWAHNQTANTQQPATKHPMYSIGLFLLALGNISSVVNLGILGQAVMAPFSALTLIYNAAFAHAVLKETYTRYDLYSTLCILTGVSLAVGGASMSGIESAEYTLDNLLDLYFRESWFPLFYTFTIIAGVLIFNTDIKRKQKESTAFGLFHFSVSAGLMGGFTALTIKSSIEIAKGPFGNSTWVGLTLFILAIPCALGPQLYYMNEGLKYFGTLQFVPMYKCFLILGNMFAGMVYFREMAAYTTVSKVLFFTGCAITLVGARILLAKVGDVEDDTKSEKDTATPLSIDAGYSA